MDFKLDYASTFSIPERPSSLPNKLLLSPGPCNISPRVLAALGSHTVGSCCEELFQMMEDIKDMLKYVFQTNNEITLALQTSGTGGVEATLCNIVDPGEKVIVAVSGLWGERTVEKAKCRNLEVIRLDTITGEIFSLEELEREIIKHKPVALLITHGESSGGTVQNLEGLGQMCHRYNCLLVVDAVVSLGGVPFFTDRWEVDVVVSAPQKAIGALAGLALITMSKRAVDRMLLIKHPPPFYYNIMNTCKMWSIFKRQRSYYVTYNSHSLYALREALLEITEEGLINRWERHRLCAERFWSGMEKLGMKMVVEKKPNRLVTATCYLPPPHIDSANLINYISKNHQVVVGFGVSQLAPNALRIGVMGYNARPHVVDYLLNVMEEAIQYYNKDTYLL